MQPTARFGVPFTKVFSSLELRVVVVSTSNLTPISAYNPRSFFSASAIFRRAAEKLAIHEVASEQGCQLALIVSAMRLSADGVEQLADNAANVYRGLYQRELNQPFLASNVSNLHRGRAGLLSVPCGRRDGHDFAK
ncbi:hypothetical protein DLM45_04380 [Hyphomicrobium methylovorum]|nr:hypothetical protein [Hyphomicrobium methylovorum]